VSTIVPLPLAATKGCGQGDTHVRPNALFIAAGREKGYRIYSGIFNESMVLFENLERSIFDQSIFQTSMLYASEAGSS